MSWLRLSTASGDLLTASGLAVMVGAPLRTVSDELARLYAAGIVERSSGRYGRWVLAAEPEGVAP